MDSRRMKTVKCYFIVHFVYSYLCGYFVTFVHSRFKVAVASVTSVVKVHDGSRSISQ